MLASVRESKLSAIMIVSSSNRSRLQVLRFGGPPAFRKKYSPQVSGIPQNARLFHCFVSLGTGRHHARLFQSRQCLGFQINFGPQGFLFFRHDLKIRQVATNCLFGARLWNKVGGKSHRRKGPQRGSARGAIDATGCCRARDFRVKITRVPAAIPHAGLDLSQH
jgi:hypothetical protein